MPIEELGLSEVAINALKRTGMTTVGDCIDHYHVSANSMISAPSSLFKAMDDEVEEKLKAHGYWSFVESDTE
jgi:hypothetical protein